VGVINDYAVVIAHGEIALTGSLCLLPSAPARFRSGLDMVFPWGCCRAEGALFLMPSARSREAAAGGFLFGSVVIHR